MLADCISMPTRTWRCVFVLLIAIAGIVTGILAMHVVSTPLSRPHEYAASDASPSLSTAHTDHVHVTAVAAPAPHDGMSSGCTAGGCDPMHDMTAMVCTLALLAATILLMAPALGRALLGLGSRAAPTNRVRMVARAVVPRPPSLLALSVDRR
ncbi:hypothetical protein KNO15_15375 [Leifsonia shinshuensis]|uniref:DUF6153 family protein n=1 Tax=Leifsonia shinshuensis TaxID=150026 RepID=UPI001F50479B|nr:DUF6153 family protein [Leifsonia shinshuensis]MCI0158081.1 hypothetical protein [Leifsonia shinshuensis]